MLACVVQRKGLDDDVCAAGDFLPSCQIEALEGGETGDEDIHSVFCEVDEGQ